MKISHLIVLSLMFMPALSFADSSNIARNMAQGYIDYYDTDADGEIDFTTDVTREYTNTGKLLKSRRLDSRGFYSEFNWFYNDRGLEIRRTYDFETFGRTIFYDSLFYYDNNGNRISETQSYDGGIQRITDYEYDNKGNMILSDTSTFYQNRSNPRCIETFAYNNTNQRTDSFKQCSDGTYSISTYSDSVSRNSFYILPDSFESYDENSQLILSWVIMTELTKFGDPLHLTISTDRDGDGLVDSINLRDFYYD